MSRHVIVVSNDAMVFEDLATLKRLPCFSKIWPEMAQAERVRSIYPSLTYPCHTTMATGVFPDRHGIVNNETPVMGERSSDWHWFHKDVKAPDVFDLAKAAGLTTAAVFWPVTGDHPHIDYLVNEYWPQSEKETMAECFANSGSTEEVIQKVVLPNLDRQVNRTHPFCDDFIYSCANKMIEEFRPNLLMIHPANIDAYRHKTGLYSDLVTHGLHEVDSWVERLILATKNAGIYEDTDFVFVSDHGQLNIVRSVAMNAILADRGLVRVDETGRLTDYIAFSKSSGLSAQVYLKNPEDSEAYEKTYQVLKQLCNEGIYGISRVYTAEEAEKEEHLRGGFSFVLESDGCSSFSNEWNRPYVRGLDVTDYRFGHATHGHHPDKGPQPTFFAFGPDFKAGSVLPKANLTDIAPTVAKVLGLSFADADGRVLTELLN